MSSNQNKLTLQGGKSRFTLQTLPADDFPLVQRGGRLRPGRSACRRRRCKGLINQVHFAMAVHDIRYYLNGILFVAEGKSLTLVATDGHRLALAQATLDAEIPKQEVILPRKTVLELQRLLRTTRTRTTADRDALCRQPGQVRFSGMEFVTKLVEGKFPDYNRVIPKNHKNDVTLGRAPLLASLQRAAILTSEKFKGVRVNIEPGTLRIASSNAEQEEAKEELEIDYAGDAIEIGFNVTYLIDALANMSAGDGQDRAAGHQLERADHGARAGRLQVRGDADAHLSAADRQPIDRSGPTARFSSFLWARLANAGPNRGCDDR